MILEKEIGYYERYIKCDSHEKALALFDTIAKAEYDSDLLIAKLGLSRKNTHYMRSIPFDKGGTNK